MFAYLIFRDIKSVAPHLSVDILILLLSPTLSFFFFGNMGRAGRGSRGFKKRKETRKQRTSVGMKASRDVAQRSGLVAGKTANANLPQTQSGAGRGEARSLASTSGRTTAGKHDYNGTGTGTSTSTGARREMSSGQSSRALTGNDLEGKSTALTKLGSHHTVERLASQHTPAHSEGQPQNVYRSPTSKRSVQGTKPPRKDLPIAKDIAKSKAGMQMVIEKLCCGDGASFRNRRQLRHGQMYAAPNMQGGIESYCAIDIRSVVLFDHGWRYPYYEVFAETPGAKRKSRPQGPVLSLPKSGTAQSKRALIRRELCKWLSEHKGFALRVGGPGARYNVVETMVFRATEYGRVFMVDNTGDCLIAAVVNAIACLSGMKQAAKARELLSMSRESFQSVRRATRSIESLRINVGLRRVAQELRSIDGIISHGEGVYIVRLLLGNETDHRVVVDCRPGCRLIFDSSDIYPLHLTADALRKCSGKSTGTKCVRAGEVRELYAAGLE